MRTFIALAGISAVCGDDPVCTKDDYAALAHMGGVPITMALCMNLNDNFDTCVAEDTIAAPTTDCISHLDSEVSSRFSACEGTCSDQHTATDACQTCVVFTHMQGVAAAAPVNAGGVCAADLTAIAAADLSTGVTCGTDTAYYAAHCLSVGAEVSTLCSNCMERHNERIVAVCAKLCSDFPDAPACQDCYNYGSMGAMAHCASSGVAGIAYMLSFAVVITAAFA